ncbi:hypothetical protein [Streptomyces sp. UH6]|uniref:hypothetical protein n=1 Tax=Streptomyces sp. UH6 TaxID=2748379 RepID=UPI0015D51F06|nr:hypothetical protein [Streptomyces sp. UH6]NYV75345.1 hypothetical protein [Streptomyces sp. UH6]
MTMNYDPETPVPHPDVTRFATGLAARLPGRWQVDPATAVVRTDPARHRIWHPGPLTSTRLATADVRRCVLTSPHGLQLYVMPRPGRPRTYVVAPMLPAGTSPVHAQDITSPLGITVPADATRAAVRVRRRLLPDYRFKAMPAWRQAATGHLRVQLFLDDHDQWAWHAPYAQAARLLIADEGHRLDPATGWCCPPADDSDRLARAVDLLGAHGYRVCVAGALPERTGQAAAGVPAHTPAPSARRAR